MWCLDMQIIWKKLHVKRRLNQKWTVVCVVDNLCFTCHDIFTILHNEAYTRKIITFDSESGSFTYKNLLSLYIYSFMQHDTRMRFPNVRWLLNDNVRSNNFMYLLTLLGLLYMVFFIPYSKQAPSFSIYKVV